MTHTTRRDSVEGGEAGARARGGVLMADVRNVHNTAAEQAHACGQRKTVDRNTLIQPFFARNVLGGLEATLN